MTKPFFIGVSGESGVGKSTIAGIISLYLDDTLLVSTDDLHKWARTSPMWDQVTHLNPAANNLELGDFHMMDLAQNKPIYRSVYNHATGYFDPPTRMEARKYVVNEGLHAFYTDEMIGLFDLKIFVDTDEDLRIHWKLIRDTEQRGYKYNDVIEAINKRRADSVKIRAKQMRSADAVIRLGTASKIASLGCKNENIVLTVEIDFPNEAARSNPLFGFIKDFMLGANDFVKMAGAVGNDVSLCQNNGGNVSVKVPGRLMIIKASGYEMKRIHGLSGHAVVEYDDVNSGFSGASISDDRTLVKAVMSAVHSGNGLRPSMETGFHSRLAKYVIHTHPIYLNVLLCLERSAELAREALCGMEYSYVGYKNPGFEISREISSMPPASVYLLENHGLIVSMDDRDEAIGRTMEINAAAKAYLSARYQDFEPFSMRFAEFKADKAYFYPDSAVFLDEETPSKREILAAHNYISLIGRQFGALRLLSKENVSFLQNMESEAFRRSI